MGRFVAPALHVRVQALILGLGGVLVGLGPVLSDGSQAGRAQAWVALAAAGVLGVLAGVLASARSVRPASVPWWILTGLEVLAILVLGYCTGGVQSSAYLLLLFLVTMSGLQRSPVTGLAVGAIGGALWGLLALLGSDPLGHLALVLAQVLALLAFGGLGYLVAWAHNAALEQMLAESSRRLEEAYATARQQAQERERREQDLFDKQRKLAGLIQLSQEWSGVRRPDELLAMVARAAKDESNSAIAMVLLVQGGELRIVRSSGLSQLTVDGFRQRAGAGLLGGIVVSGQCRRLSDADGEAWSAGLEGMRERLRTLLAVPLQSPHEKNPFGVLAVANLLVGEAYQADHEDFLKLLATDAAVMVRNISLNADLERSYFEIIQALAQAIEAKDPYTHGHVARVRTYATRLAKALGLPPDEVELVSKAAILHDVGKISVPDGILMKPGTLTEEEFGVMQAHAENALHILKDIRSLSPRIIDMVLHHHERHDGGGYPHGLKGEDIPLGAQIIGVADTFDAMTSDRPYRKGFSAEEALRRMEAAMGTQFNPRVLKTFFELFDFRISKVLTLQPHPEKEAR